MPKRITKVVTFLCIAVSMTLSACGGGGQSSSSPGTVYPAKILTWSAPNSYTDNTALNPVSDLDRFEIFVKEAGSFTEGDSPLALVSAVDPVSGQPVTAFNLANLGPFLSTGVQYQVSIRAVALTGARSAFSSPASFSF